MADYLGRMREIAGLQPGSTAWQNLVKVFAAKKIDITALPDDELKKVTGRPNAPMWREHDQLLKPLVETINQGQLQEEPHSSELGTIHGGHEGVGLLGSAAFVASLLSKDTPPELMEHDKEYQKIREQKITEWQKNNPDKNIYESREGLDFLYGNLDNPGEKSRLEKETEEAFRKSGDQIKNAKKRESFEEKLKKYDENRKKIAKDKKGNLTTEKDLAIEKNQDRLKHHLDYRTALLKKTSPKASKQEIEAYRQKIIQHSGDQFAEEYPEKTEAYAEKNEHIKNALSRAKERKQKRGLVAAQEERVLTEEALKGRTTVMPSGKTREIEVKYTEKAHRPPTTTATGAVVTPDETASRLEAIAQRSERASRLMSSMVDSQGNPLALPQEPPPLQQPPTQPPMPPSGPGFHAPGVPYNPRRNLSRMPQALTKFLKNPLWKMPGFWFAIGFLLLILIVLLLTGGFFSGGTGTPVTLPPTTSNPLQIVKSVNRGSVAVGDTIEFTIKVVANALAGDKVTITDKMPKNTTFISANMGGVLNGDTIEWNLDATKGPVPIANRIIPPEKGPAPSGVGHPVQRVTATIQQLENDLQSYSIDPHVKANALHYAEVIYNAAVGDGKTESLVDPSFLLAIWYMESHYNAHGVYKNNPYSISYIADGALGGMKKGICNDFGCWATWDTIEQGLESMALNIKTRYYPNGQIDTWTIHSGKDENDKPQFHCRCHIGVGDPSQNQIRTWNDYVNFFYRYHDVMDRITGGNYNLSQEVKFTLQAATDKKWVANNALAFAPGVGNIDSNMVVVKIGDAPDSENPISGVSGTPTRCAGLPISFGIQKKFLPFPNEKPICPQTVSGTCGRPGRCTRPQKIVLHTTAGNLDEEGTWQFFANGALGRDKYGNLIYWGTGAHYIVGKDGKALQAVETLSDSVEVAYAVENYADHISFELVHNGVYGSKNEVPPAQYQATISLVKQLMQRYNIPLGNLEYDWKSAYDGYNTSAGPGLYGHYQLNPESKSDPGAGLVRDMREDLRTVTIPPPASGGPVAQKTFNKGNSNVERIAITLDYGQGRFGKGEKLSADDRIIMDQILNTLEKHGAKVTIFATGTFYDDPDNREILTRMKNAGHEFANHTYDHKSVDNMSESEFIKQLNDTEVALRNKADKSTKPYFRYPFLADTKYLSTLAQQGYYYIRMACDGGDWREGWTAQTVLAQLKSSSCKTPGSIIILHGYTPQAAGALDQAITDYKESGYEVTTVTQVLEGLLP